MEQWRWDGKRRVPIRGEQLSLANGCYHGLPHNYLSPAVNQLPLTRQLRHPSSRILLPNIPSLSNRSLGASLTKTPSRRATRKLPTVHSFTYDCALSYAATVKMLCASTSALFPSSAAQL